MMKNGCELVVTGLTAKQGCCFSKAKVLEYHEEIHNYGNHPGGVRTPIALHCGSFIL